MATTTTATSISPTFSNLRSHHLSLLLFSPAFLVTARPRHPNFCCCLSLNHRAKTEDTQATGDLRVLFAAGETGGHIYPAVAIADELKILNPNTQILFIGTPDGMESTAVPSAGYPFAAVPAAPSSHPLLSLDNLFGLSCHLINSIVKSWQKIQEFDPQIVVGTGGYVSFSICFVAALKGLKLVIQEQNAVPGIANWVLSFLADTVFVAFDSTVDCFPRKNCVVHGNPVRLSLRNYVSKVVAKTHFFPRAGKTGDSEGKVVLVLGGTLGANAINIALLNLYHYMLKEYEDLFIIWQTGIDAFDEMASLVRNHPRLILTPFLHSMDRAYAAADVVVSRAGAMTCSEILATGKPSILIPSPNVAEGHQLKNASLMADSAGAKVITEDELDSTTLGIAIEEILDNESLQAEMSEKALKFARPSAAAEIAEHIFSLVKLST